VKGFLKSHILKDSWLLRRLQCTAILLSVTLPFVQYNHRKMRSHQPGPAVYTQEPTCHSSDLAKVFDITFSVCGSLTERGIAICYHAWPHQRILRFFGLSLPKNHPRY